MSAQPPAAGKEERKLLNSSELLASIRDLIVHLHRGNGPQAETTVEGIAGYLKEAMQAEAGSAELQRAQQTMFAIDEVRMLLGQREFQDAAAAARDAAKEWKQ